MHIAFFSDQDPATLGGLQVSLGLQRDFLESAGHSVTICAPASKKQPSPEFSRAEDVLLRAYQFGEHSFHMPGLWSDCEIDAGFADKAPVDVVHVQADAWGAWNGYRFAARHRLPIVHTMHTNIEVGVPAVTSFPFVAFKFLYMQQQHHLGVKSIRTMSDYLQAFAAQADELIVPTSHFAQSIRDYGIHRDLHIIPTGVDDRQINTLRTTPRTINRLPVFVCPGRVSKEKRLGDVIQALALSGIAAELHIYGDGPDLTHCMEMSKQLGLGKHVIFHGSVSHATVLHAIRNADAVVQSSLGFETQGLTVYEAIALGIPVVVRDPNIAIDLPESTYQAVSDPSIGALVTALQQLQVRVNNGEFSGVGNTHFSQSELTNQILDIYEHAIIKHRGVVNV